VDQELNRCPYKIRWTFGTDAWCELERHIGEVEITPQPAGQFSLEFTTLPGQPQEHTAKVGQYGVTKLNWQPGDRREFTGQRPPDCAKLDHAFSPCTLHTGHHGNCAP
jgi:hypothetical protein